MKNLSWFKRMLIRIFYGKNGSQRRLRIIEIMKELDEGLYDIERGSTGLYELLNLARVAAEKHGIDPAPQANVATWYIYPVTEFPSQKEVADLDVYVKAVVEAHKAAVEKEKAYQKAKHEVFGMIHTLMKGSALGGTLGAVLGTGLGPTVREDDGDSRT